MKVLEGKVAIVTGAARGIGRTIVTEFAKQGATVAFTVRKAEDIASLEAEIAALGATAKGYVANAADFETVHQTVDVIQKDLGRIDVLVNNAGITRDALIVRMSEKEWDEVIQNNLKSAFNYAHACSTVMLKQRSGSIINMSSVVGVHGNAGQCNYAASKAGMIALVKSLAQELGARGVRANAIAPGFILTDMTSTLPEDIQEQWRKRIPLRRAGNPIDIANVAVFLASDFSSYVTGQVITVDGGMNP